ncbi:serine hydrolase domain-containing protein [Amnibacterium kyonggiense]|uniref:CubicO group peptidase (Beta-lactamase class C family) n=1 Tax=Amnibacterium kyonggiense TaxID=595671 RepID=A0A4R7FRP3_9MICO|nr:serine hydrolase domain-containing protein [Amnibacterium kyonggiense]TDS80491.1 CubicO group peptidase (beta-lactamase class C family) [Amnibacterium kyonggiense]
MSLPRSTPSAQGVAASGVAAFVDALEALPGVDPHGLMVVRHGRVVAEGWWAPYSPDRLHLLYSLSKTFLSTAVGFAVEEGLLSLDDAVADHFPEFRDELPEASRRILVRHALAMASGHAAEMVDVALRTDPVEPVRGFLLHAPEHEPATWFAYNQPANYTVAAILQRAAGTDLVSYLRPRLLDPLGVPPVSWQEYPAGRALGFSGLHATTETIAQLGLLHLRDGVWEGRQLLPEGWAAEVRTKRVDTDREANPDWAQGYGYQVWMARHGYRGDGAYGQYCLILPEQDAVIALNSAEVDMQAVLDAVWEHLLPALDAQAEGEEADAALADRLGRLVLPPSSGAAEPTGTVPDRWEGPGLTAERTGDGVVLRDPATAVALPVGAPGWTVVDDGEGPAVAVSGGWDGDVLRLDLAFLESPHRLAVDLLPDGALVSQWATTPLDFQPGATVLDQRAPRPLH